MSIVVAYEKRKVSLVLSLTNKTGDLAWKTAAVESAEAPRAKLGAFLVTRMSQLPELHRKDHRPSPWLASLVRNAHVYTSYSARESQGHLPRG